MADTQSNSGGIGFLGALTIAFIVLKLTGVIGWSWLWVLAPLWIPWAVVLGVLAVIGLVYLVAALFEGKDRRNRRKLARNLNAYGRSVGATRKRRY